MHDLTQQKALPSCLLDYAPKQLFEIFLEHYETEVEFQWHDDIIPTLESFLSDNEEIDELIDDLASVNLFGHRLMFVHMDDDKIDNFYEERDDLCTLLVHDVKNYLNFYHMCFSEHYYVPGSRGSHRSRKAYYNFPLTGVW